MRQFTVLLVLLISQSLQAYVCPEYIDNNRAAQKAHQWLEKFQGQFELHGCEVEIIACEHSEEPEKGNPIGELLIIDKKGREAYLPISFPVKKSKFEVSKTMFNKRMFNYEKVDRFYEEEFGRTEVYRLEILTEWNNTDKIDSIDLGTYSTHKKLNQPNGNKSRWYNCKKKKPRRRPSSVSNKKDNWTDDIFNTTD